MSNGNITVLLDLWPEVVVLVERSHPPHFHAKKEGIWEVRVYFLEASSNMFKIKWGDKAFSAKDRKALEEMVKVCRDEILKEWETKVKPS